MSRAPWGHLHSDLNSDLRAPWLSATALPMLAPMVLLFILPFPGTVALRLIALSVALASAAWCWRGLDVPPLPCKAAIGFWAAIALASLASAIDPSYTLGEIKNEVGYSLVAFVSLFVLTTDERRLRLAMLAVTAALLVIAIAATATYAWTGAWAPEPWYGGSPSTTHYVMLAGPAAGVAALLTIPQHVGKACWAVVGILAVLGILATERAIWPALGAQGVVLAWWLWRNGYLRSRYRRAALIAGVAIALPLGGLFATEWQRRQADPAAAMERDLRPYVWRNALERIVASPLTGAGLGRQAFWKAHRDLVPPENHYYWHTHNMVLNYGVSAGLPGMLAIVLLFAAMGWRFCRLALSDERTIAVVGLAGLLMVIGVFARNMFNDFFVRDGALLFWSVSGALLGYALRRCKAAAKEDAGFTSR
jgi:O-antigen ligase